MSGGSSVRHEELFSPLWLSAFWVEVPFPIRSKSNFRRYSGGGGSGEWREFQAFATSVGVLARAAMPGSWSPPDGAVKLAARPPVVAFVAAASRVDAANFSKSVLDACEKVLFVTDAQVLGEMSIGVRGLGGSFALGFAQLTPGSGPVELRGALTELSSLVLDRYEFS